MPDRLLELTEFAVFVFGALTFLTLASFYVSERLRNTGHRSGTVLPVFTLVCAVAFVNNLLFQTSILQSAGAWLALSVLAVASAAVGLLPALILHLVVEIGEGARRRAVRLVLAGFYAVSAASAAARYLQEIGVVSSAPWGAALIDAPAIALAAASAMGLVWLARAAGHFRVPAIESQRRWTGALLSLMLVCALCRLSGKDLGFGSAASDYLLLALLPVTLYYRERLVFFDVLLKRGVFLALGLLVLVGGAVAINSIDAKLCLIAGLALWLTGPSLYNVVARVVDRVWLRRTCSPAEAERRFIRAVQSAATEEELQRQASESISAIFHAPVRICLAGEPPAQIALDPRPDGIPFLSDDHRLLQSLAGTFGMVLENIRYRAESRRHEEREQQLLLLASRAELKALRAQIDPHFLFNTLSVITGLMQYQPELADETIENLSQVFRYTLRKSESEWAPLGDEVEFIKAYLRIEQARFGARLKVHFDLDPDALRVPIPAMSLQPLVENAIRHGIAVTPEPGELGVRVRLTSEDKQLSIEVTDTGPGFPAGFSLQQPGESHGLRNVYERLRGYYGDEAEVVCTHSANDEASVLTRVVLTFPVAAAVGAAR